VKTRWGFTVRARGAASVRRRRAFVPRSLFLLTFGFLPVSNLAVPAWAAEDAPIGTVRFDDTTVMPIYFEPPEVRADGSARLFLWPSEEEVDGATRLLIGQSHEQYDQDIRVMSEIMLGRRQQDGRNYPSTLKEMVLAPLALKTMFEPKVDFFGIPTNCRGKASFSGAYAACSLAW
jgi:hypothetical protein